MTLKSSLGILNIIFFGLREIQMFHKDELEQRVLTSIYGKEIVQVYVSRYDFRNLNATFYLL